MNIINLHVIFNIISIIFFEFFFSNPTSTQTIAKKKKKKTFACMYAIYKVVFITFISCKKKHEITITKTCMQYIHTKINTLINNTMH